MRRYTRFKRHCRVTTPPMRRFFNGCRMKILHSVMVADLKPSSRIKTAQGFLVCQGAKLAKPTVKEYYASELGIADGVKSTDVINIYTSPDVLFSDDVIAGFEGADVVLIHPQGNQLTADNYKDHIIGTAKNVRADNGYLVADLTIKDKAAIDAIEQDNIKQISLGYSAQIDMTAGSDAGLEYHGQWVSMTADHIAIVSQGRCGSDCAIGDNKSQTKEVYMQKVKVSGIEYDVGDNASLAQAIDKQTGELNALKQRKLKIGDADFSLEELDAAQATINALIDDKKALSDEVADLKSKEVTQEQVSDMVADRVKAIADATKLNDKIVTDGKSTAQIKRDVVTAKADDTLVKAIVGDKVADAQQSVIDMAFKALVATADSKPATSVADAALNGLNNVQDGKTKDSYQQYKDKLSTAYKGAKA